jgi:hypothetical protein
MSQIRHPLLTAAPAAASAFAIAVAALAVGGCSARKSPPHPPATGHALAAPSSKAPASSKATAPAAGALSGKWSGQYSGSYQGTFVLHWRQNGSRLKGRIRISNPGNLLPINGFVRNGAIRFGTVGSTAITYSGTVSGGSMSGHWSFHGGSGAGGPWSASKDS